MEGGQGTTGKGRALPTCISLLLHCSPKVNIYAHVSVYMSVHKHTHVQVPAAVFMGKGQERCHPSQDASSLVCSSSNVSALPHSWLTHSQTPDASRKQCTGRVGTCVPSCHFAPLQPQLHNYHSRTSKSPPDASSVLHHQLPKPTTSQSRAKCFRQLTGRAKGTSPKSLEQKVTSKNQLTQARSSPCWLKGTEPGDLETSENMQP